MLRKQCDERGGAAVLLSVILSVVLLGVGAFAVDMGQAYAKRSALQSNVDLAVLAAAAELDNPGACNSEVVTKATEYLLKPGNKVSDQVPVNLGGSPGDDDGYIRCNNWRVELWAPMVAVDFGLAKALSDTNDSVDVPAHAVAQIKSPGNSYSLPMYAVSGCDYGSQTISDPPPGPPPSNDPPELTPTGAFQIKNLAITPSEAPDGAVPDFPVSVTGQVKDATSTTQGQVIFVNPADGSEVPAGTPASLPTGPWMNFTINLTTVPSEVLNVPGIWWVRIKVTDGPAPVDYSPSDESVPFTNGELMFCDGTVSGNFGTLKVARSDAPAANWLERNIIKGLQPELQINASNVVPCSPVDSEHTPTNPTDCLSTDPGFPNEAATDGLVNGSGGDPGRLDKDTTPNCDRNGGSLRTQSGPAALNDDMLSCFIVTGDDIQAVVDGTERILSPDIFKSPRFFMIPVIPVEASNGASGAYPIVGFRPGFITSESMSATNGNPGAVTDHNGVHFHAGNVERLDVVLFDENALPDTAPAVGGESDYTGSGPKVIVLVE